MAERKTFPLRMDPALFAALQRWSDDELRSLNGQIEYLLRDALRRSGRLPRAAGSPGDDPPGEKSAGEEPPGDGSGAADAESP